MTDALEPVVDLMGVDFAYRRTVALRGAWLQVAAGEVVVVTGPSGSGKSTLLLVAAGILRPQGGRVRLLGQDLSAMDEAARTRLRRRQVGVVLQYGQLVPDLSVLDNVALPLLFEGHDRSAARTAAADWLGQVGLAAECDATPVELSAGQAQRAAVARALVTGPRVVFADEPTGSLDTVGGEELLDLLLSATRERQAALVLVTHDNLVAARADREVHLRDGRVCTAASLR
jgi:putative ABC transport system ATP-binding protein